MTMNREQAAYQVLVEWPDIYMPTDSIMTAELVSKILDAIDAAEYELWTIADVSKYLGRRGSSVRSLLSAARSTFPQPVFRTSAGPLMDAQAVRDWALVNQGQVDNTETLKMLRTSNEETPK